MKHDEKHKGSCPSVGEASSVKNSDYALNEIDVVLRELSSNQPDGEAQSYKMRLLYQCLADTKKMFRHLYENAPIAYITVNSKGEIGMANDLFYKHLGLPKNTTLLSKPLADYIYKEDRSLFDSILRVFYENPEKHQFSMRLQSGDAITHTVVQGRRYSGIAGMARELEGYDLLMTLTDITKEKVLEEELGSKNEALRAINATLQKRVEEETEQRLKNEQIIFAQKRFADMGEMLSSIAHQWRQPLNVLGLVMQSVKEEKECSEKSELNDILDTGMDVVNYLSETITDFKDFFRPVRSMQRFNVTLASFHAVRLLRSQLETDVKDIVFQCECDEHSFSKKLDDELPDCVRNEKNVLGYENEFKQVLLNLVFNAREAIHLSGKADGRIKISIRNNPDSVVVSVTDNGGGIPADIRDKVFEPYFTTKYDMNGTGIGLYMCKTIVEKHFKGDITFEDTEDGTVFSVVLPTDLEL